MKTAQRNKRNFAFTLIELLVVVSIIALLVSILLPALGRAREVARSSVCQSNFKQYGLTIMMYMEDNEGVLPPHVDGQWHGWWSFLVPYIGADNEKVVSLHCPSFKRGRELGVLYTGYNFNANLSYKKYDNIRFPGITPFVYDDEQTSSNPYGGYLGGGGWYNFGFRHNDCCNFGMVDSSVSFIRRVPGGTGGTPDYPGQFNWTGADNWNR